MHRALLIVMSMLPVPATAQGTWLRGTVTDVEGHALSDVHIQAGGARSAITDARGVFLLRFPTSGRLDLVLSHVSKERLARTVHRVPGADTTHVHLRMVPGMQHLPELTIRPRGPEVVHQDPVMHVGDHRVNDEGVWVLEYRQVQLWHPADNPGEQLFRDARLVLLDTAFRPLATTALPGRVRQLHLDHQDRLIVEGEQLAWFAQVEAGRIELQPVDREVLHGAILPWSAHIPHRLIGNDRIDHWPAFHHFAHDTATAVTAVVHTVIDELMMALFRSQYKYMSGRDKVQAMDLGRALGLDPEVVAGYMTGFQHDPYFHVPYAPLFVVADTIVVFDHADERIHRYRTDLEAWAAVPMRHHRQRGWRDKLLFDRADATVLARYDVNGRVILRPVHLHDGGLGRPHILTHRFPDGVQVHGGHAYYLYRTPGSLQRRTLYREALR